MYRFVLAALLCVALASCGSSKTASQSDAGGDASAKISVPIASAVGKRCYIGILDAPAQTIKTRCDVPHSFEVVNFQDSYIVESTTTNGSLSVLDSDRFSISCAEKLGIPRSSSDRPRRYYMTYASQLIGDRAAVTCDLRYQDGLYSDPNDELSDAAPPLRATPFVECFDALGDSLNWNSQSCASPHRGEKAMYIGSADDINRDIFDLCNAHLPVGPPAPQLFDSRSRPGHQGRFIECVAKFPNEVYGPQFGE